MFKTISRKQRLLKRHRRARRGGVAVFACVVVGIAIAAGVFWALLVLVCGWIAHEAWFSDHFFYSAATDYVYNFGDCGEDVPVEFSCRCLKLAGNVDLDGLDTLILSLDVCADFSGRFLDPAVVIESIPPDPQRDKQVFERGVWGTRYLNVTGFGAALRENGLRLSGRHCRLGATARLWRIRHPDYRQKRILVVAPHADDAELAAFGLYSQAKEAWVVTLTAGENGNKYRESLNLSTSDASRLKGRLRAWDSVAVPLWAGVPVERSIQLGYFGMRLSAMHMKPTEPVSSLKAELCDTRVFRAFNSVRLSSDANGTPSWSNLISDLRELFLLVKPEVIVLPHPIFDPHPDHVAATEAVLEALASASWQPEVLLHYANHLHDNNRWPLGDTHDGVALLPNFDGSNVLCPWSLSLNERVQIDKAMALRMLHELAKPQSFKQRVRRVPQRFLAGRNFPLYGDNSYFRRSVRRHEIFWVERYANASTVLATERISR
jgi:LmbE family N-acetylglucosaminyl deacetylase